MFCCQVPQVGNGYTADYGYWTQAKEFGGKWVPLITDCVIVGKYYNEYTEKWLVVSLRVGDKSDKYYTELPNGRILVYLPEIDDISVPFRYEPPQ